jgi:hypothetical protein
MKEVKQGNRNGKDGLAETETELFSSGLRQRKDENER